MEERSPASKTSWADYGSDSDDDIDLYVSSYSLGSSPTNRADKCCALPGTGDIVEGRVVGSDADGVLIDIGISNPAFLSLDDGAGDLEVGDEVDELRVLGWDDEARLILGIRSKSASLVLPIPTDRSSNERQRGDSGLVSLRPKAKQTLRVAVTADDVDCWRRPKPGSSPSLKKRGSVDPQFKQAVRCLLRLGQDNTRSPSEVAKQLSNLAIAKVAELAFMASFLLRCVQDDARHVIAFADVTSHLSSILPEAVHAGKTCSFMELLGDACRVELWRGFHASSSCSADEFREKADVAEKRKLALTRFLGHLVVRHLLRKEMVGIVVSDLLLLDIEFGVAFPNEHDVQVACALLEVVGRILHDAVEGDEMLSRACSRLEQLRNAKRTQAASVANLNLLPMFSKRTLSMISVVMGLQNAGWTRNEGAYRGCSGSSGSKFVHENQDDMLCRDEGSFSGPTTNAQPSFDVGEIRTQVGDLEGSIVAKVDTGKAEESDEDIGEIDLGIGTEAPIIGDAYDRLVALRSAAKPQKKQHVAKQLEEPTPESSDQKDPYCTRLLHKIQKQKAASASTQFASKGNASRDSSNEDAAANRFDSDECQSAVASDVVNQIKANRDEDIHQQGSKQDDDDMDWMDICAEAELALAQEDKEAENANKAGVIKKAIPEHVRKRAPGTKTSKTIEVEAFKSPLQVAPEYFLTSLDEHHQNDDRNVTKASYTKGPSCVSLLQKMAKAKATRKVAQSTDVQKTSQNCVPESERQVDAEKLDSFAREVDSSADAHIQGVSPAAQHDQSTKLAHPCASNASERDDSMPQLAFRGRPEAESSGFWDDFDDDSNNRLGNDTVPSEKKDAACTGVAKRWQRHKSSHQGQVSDEKHEASIARLLAVRS